MISFWKMDINLIYIIRFLIRVLMNSIVQDENFESLFLLHLVFNSQTKDLTYSSYWCVFFRALLSERRGV